MKQIDNISVFCMVLEVKLIVGVFEEMRNLDEIWEYLRIVLYDEVVEFFGIKRLFCEDQMVENVDILELFLFIENKVYKDYINRLICSMKIKFEEFFC